jgi:hypothetical protein
MAGQTAGRRGIVMENPDVPSFMGLADAYEHSKGEGVRAQIENRGR